MTAPGGLAGRWCRTEPVWESTSAPVHRELGAGEPEGGAGQSETEAGGSGLHRFRGARSSLRSYPRPNWPSRSTPSRAVLASPRCRSSAICRSFRESISTLASIMCATLLGAATCWCPAATGRRVDWGVRDENGALAHPADRDAERILIGEFAVGGRHRHDDPVQRAALMRADCRRRGPVWMAKPRVAAAGSR